MPVFTEPVALPGQLYSAAQTRELDRLAMAAGIPGAELMTRAGQAAFDTLRRLWPRAHRLAVLCGGGNNGGDGYVVAHLAWQAGLAPRIYFTREPAELSGDALTMAQRCQAAAIPMQRLTPQTLPQEADLLVDGLLGTGLSGTLRDDVATLLQALRECRLPSLALDIPSGLSADTGMPLGPVLSADATCTFIGVKRGLLTGAGPAHTGALSFFPLAVPASVYQQLNALWRPRPQDLAVALPPRRRDAHKGHHGHVLVIGGDYGFGGAALMTAQAAARTGAGLVSLATRAEHVAASLIRQPEVMAHAVQDADQLAPLLKTATVVAVGPGLGQQAWGRCMLDAALASGKPLVVDADGLNRLAQLDVGQGDWVLTPHPGEAARLLATDTATVNQDRFAALEMLATRYGGTVLLKGVGTLVAGEPEQPGGPSRALVTDGNPGMATGGMGDVLTGVIAGLRAQGVAPFAAAALAAMVHGRAADQAAEQAGERGMLASDLMVPLQAQVNREGREHDL